MHHSVGTKFVFDIETYPNMFLVMFKEIGGNGAYSFELSQDSSINTVDLLGMFWRYETVGFNSENYDLPMISLFAKYENMDVLKEGSDFIVDNGFGYIRNFMEKYKVQVPKYNHVDLINIAPLMGSLKLYTARLHCKTIKDLPFDADHVLTSEEAKAVRQYCWNDLLNTELLYEKLKPEVDLRRAMSKEYDVELRSKSDAQIAEAVLCKEIAKVLGRYPDKVKSVASEIVYSRPDFVGFQTPKLQSVLQTVCDAKFELNASGSPLLPGSLAKLKVKIGESTYKLGMGGLHSSENSVAHVAKENEIISDNDVESFYPRIILNQGLYPLHLGPSFLTAYEKIVNTRLEAKRNGNKVISDSLKITINGSFGKLGNKFSRLYSPDLLLQVTITGQLVLLMLIEALELNGISVISANTDGVVLKYDKSERQVALDTIKEWESRTAFKTEETQYSALYSRDVNNYIAVKPDGGNKDSPYLDEMLGCKTKGAYCERGSALNSPLSRNPDAQVCVDAVLRRLTCSQAVEDTIRGCQDVRRFVSVRNVRGEGSFEGARLGRVVRWYYAKNAYDCIRYVTNGNKVPRTDGCKPLMTLPDSLPNDIDYERYIEIANEMLFDCGAYTKAKTGTLF